MTDLPTLSTDPPDASKIGCARQRIDHVVVLMLENRSFDHLLGFSDRPEVTPLDPAQHVNPAADDPAGIRADQTGRGSFVAGPPHTHMAAMKQLGRFVKGKPAMDGFVTAYEEELVGRGFRPHYHWRRMFGAGMVLALPLAVALFDLVCRWSATWDGFGWWNLGLPAFIAATGFGRPLGKISGVPWLLFDGAVVLLAALAYLVSEGSTHLARHPAARVLWWVLGTEIIVVAALTLTRHLTARRAPAANRALASTIMDCLPPDRLPVLNELARQFVLCEGWFSSVPGATWPNRNFLHSGTSEQAVDIEVGFYPDRTIFELLDHALGTSHNGSPTWRIYSPDGSTPQVMCFDKLWRSNEQDDNWCRITDFVEHAKQNALPVYSFLEPAHRGVNSNSMHPANNIVAGAPTGGLLDIDRGDQLLREIYDAISARDHAWEDTMLIITFDEHGGTFDRMPPPKTVPPDFAATIRHPLFNLRRLVAWFVENQSAPFNFRRYGVRVPTIIISAWIQPGQLDKHVYDHTSIPETVRQLFAPNEPPLTRRAKHARPFWDLVVASKTPIDPMPSLPPVAGRAEPAVGMPGVEAEPAAARGDQHTGGDIADQLDRIEELGHQRLDGVGAPSGSLEESGAPVDLVTRFKAWAEQERLAGT